MGLTEKANEILDELEKRGIKYPDKLYTDMKTLRTSLDSIGCMFNFGKKNG